MPAFRRASTEAVNVFPVEETYLFKHYFEGEAVFDRLRPFYNFSQYRFEVPPEEFEGLRDFLAGHGYGLVLVESLDPFTVVVEQYTAHPEDIFKRSVVQRSTDGYNAFLMTDREAVEDVVTAGATRLADTDLPNPF